MESSFIKSLLLSFILSFIGVFFKSLILIILSGGKFKSIIFDFKIVYFLYEFITIFLLLTISIFLILRFNFSDRSIIGMIISIFIVSIIPTYSFVLEPLYKYSKAHSYSISTHIVKDKIFNKFRIIESDAPILNAYATGVIPFTKTIVVGRDLKDKLTEKEMEAVLYHEIFHLKENHLLKLFIVNLSLNIIGVIIFSFVKDEIKLLSYSPVWVGLYWSFFMGLLLLISSQVQRVFEKQADLFSVMNTKDLSIILALERIDIISGGKVSKKSLNYPTLQERKRFIYEKTTSWNIN